jgi:hypothetical protein
MKELELLRDKVKLLDAPSFFEDNSTLKDIEISCTVFLKVLGYKVVKKEEFTKISKLDELIDLFYNLLDYYHNDLCSLVSNRQKDRKIFSSFITLRQEELGCTFSEGLQDCSRIIKALFIYEDLLELSLPIGTWVFGSSKCKWITDKIIGMIDGNQALLNEYVLEKMVDEDEGKSKEYTGFDFERLRRLYGE